MTLVWTPCDISSHLLTFAFRSKISYPTTSVQLQLFLHSNLPCLSRFIMENGAKGVEVIISGKLRAQRAKVGDGGGVCVS